MYTKRVGGKYETHTNNCDFRYVVGGHVAVLDLVDESDVLARLRVHRHRLEGANGVRVLGRAARRLPVRVEVSAPGDRPVEHRAWVVRHALDTDLQAQEVPDFLPSLQAQLTTLTSPPTRLKMRSSSPAASPGKVVTAKVDLV